MQMGIDAKIGGHLRVPVGDGIRVAVPPMVGRVGEDEAVVGEGHPEFRALLFGALLVGGQDRDSLGIEVDDAHLVSLGVLDDRLAVLTHQVAPDGQQPGRQVQVLPCEAKQLAGSRAGDKGQPHQRAPVGILLPRRTHDPRSLLG